MPAPFDERQFNALVELYRQGQAELALARAAELVREHPGVANLHNLIGVITAALGRGEEALAAYDRAVALHPGYADAWNNRGNALRRLGRMAEAVESFDRAVAQDPGFASAHFNRGSALQELGRPGDAVAAFDRSLALRPDHVASLRRRAAALFDLGRAHEALADYERLVALDPADADAHCAMGNCWRELQQPEPALASYERALRIRPDFAYALARKLSLASYVCDWPALASIDLTMLGLAGDPVPPFAMLLVDDDPERNLIRAQRWSEHMFGPTAQPEPAGSRPPPEMPGAKIRIGYFSADFQAHATMVLMASLFERHDASRFEVHAFSYGPDADDAMRSRLRATVARFHDVRHLPDADVAALARGQGIDLAVDLKGYTLAGRPGIFAHRAAPVQIGFLGYPGTMGAGFIDYLIADPVLVPPGDERFYGEKLIRLPGSYQVNDDRREIADRSFARTELGLPDKAFVFCCFNNSYKITPAEFDLWMPLLARVPGSVLWLIRDNAFAEAALRREALARGVAPERLIFAERMPLPEHLARHGCADLFLDTFACNAHTTASDALWTGLPIVTLQGRGFPARVAGSLLHACGLPELVTGSAADYAALALRLATEPAALAAIRAKLAAQLPTAPLFDVAAFTKAIEEGYRLAFGRFAEGLGPEHIDVPAR
jgi:predicted O-linked N-acetylglucosamine transferase (SPINDLY family)